MAKDWLAGIRDRYDAVVIGSGLGGLTAANQLARSGHAVLLLERHYQFGGLATWFRRPGRHIFDISLHGFPAGMIKSCRKYWSGEIASRIVRLRGLRFRNPQFSFETTYEGSDFRQKLIEVFGLEPGQVASFFERLDELDPAGNGAFPTGDLFEEHFPGRDDVHRALIEPIAFANGSTLEDPAGTFAVVFRNFMRQGVFTFTGGTDHLINAMTGELEGNGVHLRKCAGVEAILTEDTPRRPEEGPAVQGVRVNGRDVACRAVISNAGLQPTLFGLLGESRLPADFAAEARAVRLNNSSCQIYFGLKAGTVLPDAGDLVFTSEAGRFSPEELTGSGTTSRTFSIYYPEGRPYDREPRPAIVSSINARWADWEPLDEAAYQREKERLCQENLAALERLIPGIGASVAHLEAATPRTIHHYTGHHQGASFGTKFEGLAVSRRLPRAVPGLFHAGSVGIIMSGWLGTMNYGVIVADEADRFLRAGMQPEG